MKNNKVCLESRVFERMIYSGTNIYSKVKQLQKENKKLEKENEELKKWKMKFEDDIGDAMGYIIENKSLLFKNSALREVIKVKDKQIKSLNDDMIKDYKDNWEEGNLLSPKEYEEALRGKNK